METKLIITPKTRVSELLDAYPELEEALIEMAPEFKKLRNPILRRTIARVTSLQQAAAVAGISVDIAVNRLRSLTGQDALDNIGDNDEYAGKPPGWFDPGKIKKSFDAREIISQGGHPLGDVLRDLSGWDHDGIYEFITPFLPAPLIDKVKEMGFDAWSTNDSDGVFRNYFFKK